MRTLIGILEPKLGPDDQRWDNLGLNRPGMDGTPAAPLNLTATSHADGSIAGMCNAKPLATRYRWRTKFVGAESAYTLKTSTVDPMAMHGAWWLASSCRQ